jgi:hypothetical protein
MTTQTFSATLEPRPGGGVAVRLPFDPSTTWGDKDRHHVTGSIEGCRIRGALTRVGDAYELRLGPAWRRGLVAADGASVLVTMAPEGPQRSTMPPDFVVALEAEPDAMRFFESLATFYRNAYLRPIEQAKRSETRVRRIAAAVAALKAGHRLP